MSRSPYLPDMAPAAITAAVARPVLHPAWGWRWWLGFGVSAALTLLFVLAVGWLFYRGVGVWGVDTSNIWGFALANYVWWIGIGNAGTLISALLLLTRQRWRASISRFAEAMTLFAAAMAGLMPILHLGRPWLFYWLVPYPDTMGLLPQWRSPLVWDFFAIASYLLFSMMFWYAGALPDFASLRDRARTRGRQLFYGVLAMGWRNSARHWRIWRDYYGALAALGVPLVVSVHSVVGMDFSATLMPGWAETIFPPYFVVGAMYSGFAMVVVLAAIFRRALSIPFLITDAHFEVMARILLFCSLVMTLSYATEWFYSWYSQDPAELDFTRAQFTGPRAPLYAAMLVCNCLVPMLFWRRALRRSVPVVVGVSLLINLGMWLERVLIVTQTLSLGFLPSQRASYVPTFWDWAVLLGSLGCFSLLFFLFIRIVPAASIHEIKEAIRAEAAS